MPVDYYVWFSENIKKEKNVKKNNFIMFGFIIIIIKKIKVN